MDIKVDISIIVPIYNQELHLEKCLSSLLNIKDLNIEIICINDGSNDRSLEIMEEYQRNDSRIRIINKENTGYGDSMNCGIASAEGKYIFFIESDDWLADYALNDLFDNAEKFSTDIVKGNYYIYNSGKDKVSIYENLKNFQYNCLVQKPLHLYSRSISQMDRTDIMPRIRTVCIVVGTRYSNSPTLPLAPWLARSPAHHRVVRGIGSSQHRNFGGTPKQLSTVRLNTL